MAEREVMRGFWLEGGEEVGLEDVGGGYVQIGRWVDGKVKRFQVIITRIVMLGGAAAGGGSSPR